MKYRYGSSYLSFIAIHSELVTISYHHSDNLSYSQHHVIAQPYHACPTKFY